MPLTREHRRAREQRKPDYAVFEADRIVRRRRPRIRLFLCVVLLVLVTLGGLAYLSASALKETEDEPSEQHQAVIEQGLSEETATEEGETGSAAPDDPRST